MNRYVTGTYIREQREKNNMTQLELAEKLFISDKTVSKWETGKGLPDISMLEELAKALRVSVIELLSGEYVTNRNICANMLRSKFYVCPVCGNIIYSSGNAVISCCGITLPALEAEDADERHKINIEKVEDERFITVSHEMSKTHYISFIAYVTGDTVQLVKLYPEGDASARFKIRSGGVIYIYCNRHGLMKIKP